MFFGFRCSVVSLKVILIKFSFQLFDLITACPPEHDLGDLWCRVVGVATELHK